MAGDLTYAQLEAVWQQGGGSGQTAPVAAAIAEAESSGSATVTSSNPDGGTNVGLWQLDTPGGKGAGYSVGQLQDPLTNAQVAVAGSGDGADWSAWATYASGAYKAFLGGNSAPAAPASSSPFSNIKWYEPWTWANAPADAVTQATDEIVHLGGIVLVAAAGLALVVFGLIRATGHQVRDPVTVLQEKAAPAATAAALA